MNSRYLMHVVGIAALAAIVYFNLDRRPPGHKRAQAVAPNAPAQNAIRPRTWFGDSYAERPDPASFKKFQDAIRLQAARETAIIADHRSQLSGLDDTVALKRIRSMQQRVAEAPEPSGAWKWGEVKEAVQEFGRDIKIMDGHRLFPGSSAFCSYDTGTGTLIVFPDNIRQLNDDEFSGGLIHEATHRVASQHMERVGSLTTEEHLALTESCIDFRFADAWVQELLAFTNEGAWNATRHAFESAPVERGDIQLMRKAAQVRLGAERERRALGQLATGYVQHALRGVPKNSPACGVPRILKGPRAGSLFFPSDIAPEILVPILDATYP